MFGYVRQSTCDAAIERAERAERLLAEQKAATRMHSDAAHFYAKERDAALARLSVFTGPRKRDERGLFVSAKS